MPISIREATADDAVALIAFVQELALEPDIDLPMAPGEFTMTVDEERKFLENCHAADNMIFLVAEAAGEIVGVLDVRGGRRSRLRHAATLGLSVRRGWRQQGIGNALMTQAIAWARSTGVLRRIELQVYCRNEAAIHLYQKHGFEIEGRRRHAVYQNGGFLDDYVMALLL